MLRKPAKYLLFFFAGIALSLIVCFVLIVDRSPLVTVNAAEQLDDADSMRRLVNQLRYTLNRRYRTQNITLLERQLNSLVGLIRRAEPNFHGEIDVNPSFTQLRATYALPNYLGGGYLNLSGALLPANRVLLDTVTVGSLNLPGEWVMSLAEHLANWYTRSDIATLTLAQIERVSMTPTAVRFRVKPLEDWLSALNEIQLGVSSMEDDLLRQRTNVYLSALDSLAVAKVPQARSLTDYLSPLFALVRDNSTDADPVLENEAAILALAIFAGHPRLAAFVGDLPANGESLASPLRRPTLSGREDLTRHFVLSAAIKILSEQGISEALGEFKELMDRASGGSGYSFVDMAADMAGINFAILATDPRSAKKVQQMLASPELQEGTFFPNISGLPEGLDKQAFTQTYGRIDSPAYRQQLEEIEQRLQQLPLYRLNS